MSDKANEIGLSLKPKTLGLFFVILGIGLLLLALADSIYMLFYFNPEEPLIEAILYTASDIAFYLTAFTSWAISAKLLQKKGIPTA